MNNERTSKGFFSPKEVLWFYKCFTKTFIRICGALWTTPIIALSGILHVTPVDIAVRCMAVKISREVGALRNPALRPT